MRQGAAAFALFVLLLCARAASAGQEPTSRAATIEQAEAEKAAALHPFKPDKVEAAVNRISDVLLNTERHWHSFWSSAYSGGGFPIGIGYQRFVSPYNVVDVRGSVTASGYKRIEAEFIAPRLFERRGALSIVGGWREATAVEFYGLGTASALENKAAYSFQQPYASALLEVRPFRGLFLLTGGVEISEWKQAPATEGSSPSVETIYTPATLPGLGAQPTYLHSQGTIGVDWRTSPGYARRGGFYGVTVHDFADADSRLGFDTVEYEAIQHVPILRDVWVLSAHARVQTTYTKDNQQVPFFMLPSLGGGSDLRAYPSWRFRDNNSLLLQAEWRVLVNRLFDTAVFADAGKVTSLRADLDLGHLKTDYGVGFRIHGPAVTALRIELTRGSEGFGLVFAASQAF
jgi:hypothetical protein